MMIIAKNIALNKLTLAQQQLGSWVRTNRVEENYAKFFNWTILRRQNKIINLPDVELLATRCPQTDGNVVFAAQNLYNAITNKHKLFINNCDYKADTAASKKTGSKPIAVTLEEANPIKIYPNPATTVINISGNDIKKIELLDMYGKLLVVKDGKTRTVAIPITQLVNGMYLLKVTGNNNKVTTHKFFKSK